MEVTKKNFKEVLPQVQDAVNASAFVAVDLEFSGLHLPGQGIHGLDTVVERYHKLRHGCSEYTVFQFGLCCFEHNTAENRYVQRAFNFYIFPRQFGRTGSDTRFLCQSSSIEFLSNQGFDFNKVFRDGISYLRPGDELRLKENLEQKHKDIAMKEAMQSSPHCSPAFRSPVQVPQQHQEFINKVIGQIEEFKKSDKEELPLSPCNGFLRKLIYQTVEQKFKNEVHAGTQTKDKMIRLVITKVSGEDEIKVKEEAKRQSEVQEIDDAVGFAKVISIISQSGKLVVGHNMILDLLHILAHFVGPLPELYSEFKMMAMGVFPRICDTKLMADTQPFKENLPNHSLNGLQKSLEIAPFSTPNIDAAEGFPSYSTATEQYHEAGYDAYVTGLCFISMMNYLGSIGPSDSPPITPKSPFLQPFFNKLFLMRLYDIPYMNLEGEDIQPCRDHVFHVQFSPEWKASDLANLFIPFGGIQITWIDDVSAFASLYRREESGLVLKSLRHGHHFKVTSYNDYYNRTNKLASPSNVNPELKRKIPTSDIDLPNNNKRRRSHSSEKLSPYLGDRAITPIIEEDEEADGNKDVMKKSMKEKLTSTNEETPKRKETPKKRALFEEPQDW